MATKNAPTRTRRVAVMPDGSRHPIKKTSQGWAHVKGTDMEGQWGAGASHQDSVIDSVKRAGGRIETEQNPDYERWLAKNSPRLPVFEDLTAPLFGTRSPR
jgi:hypothetical protein